MGDKHTGFEMLSLCVGAFPPLGPVKEAQLPKSPLNSPPSSFEAAAAAASSPALCLITEDVSLLQPGVTEHILPDYYTAYRDVTNFQLLDLRRR